MKHLYEVVPVVGGISMRGLFANDVLNGLTRPPGHRSLDSRWFYDDRGSELFVRIMALEEYYPTRCEREILELHAGAIAGLMPPGFRLVELGAGDMAKTRVLLTYLLRNGIDVECVPVDISEAAVASATSSLASEMPDLRVAGRVQDYFDALEWLGSHGHAPTLALLLGSNIGNFDDGGDVRFLRRLHASLRPGDAALVGFDLVKDPRIMVPAYSDSLGVTSEFNLNLLDRINRELRGDFRRKGFRQRTTWNPGLSRIESHLVSTVDQVVTILDIDAKISFHEGEAIHTESSVKYTEEMIRDLANATGLYLEQTFLDTKGWFADVVFRKV